MRITVLLGLPASGKGTQAKYLAAGGYELASMSGLLNARADACDDDISRDIRKAMANGDLASDDATNAAMLAFIEKKLQEGTDELVLDGYPRTLVQALFLEQVLTERNIPATIINLQADDRQVLNERRLIRIQQALDAGKKPRSDDLNEEVFFHRIEDARVQLKPVVDFYGKSICNVNALAPEAEVREAIRAILHPPPLSTPVPAPRPL